MSCGRVPLPKHAKAKSLAEREEEYRQLNEELEKKTNKLLKEADEVLSKTNILRDSEIADEYVFCSDERQVSTSADLFQVGDEPEADHYTPRDNLPVLEGQKQTGDGLSSFDNPLLDPLLETTSPVPPHSLEPPEHDQSQATEDLDDILPGPAAELSLKAQNRYLKAKTRVLQEELDKLTKELSQKNAESFRLSGRVRELEEERARLHSNTSQCASQLDRIKKSLFENRERVETLESENAALRKNLDALKRNLDQQVASGRTASARLTNQLKETDRQRNRAETASSMAQQAQEKARQQVAELTNENKRLERQKADLITGFKKQMRLIDVLRRQKEGLEEHTSSGGDNIHDGNGLCTLTPLDISLTS